MSAPDQIILKILIHNTRNGNTDPLAATAELAHEYGHHPEWIDRLKCAAKDIEDYKKRNSFKTGTATQEDFYSIVPLGEGKERIWSFRGYMDRAKILTRIALITKKDQEHHEATQEEITYWNGNLN
jgi:pterin-4a-carbinolamine dehydratase